MSLANRLWSLIGFPRQTAPSIETGPLSVTQLSHQTTGEKHDGMRVVQIFGFASVAQVGCDHVVVYGEGDRSKGVSIASNDQRFRPRGMLAGESQQYDTAGQFIYLKGGALVVVNAKTEIDFQINGTLVGKFTSAGLAVTGTITATGDIVAGQGGADQVSVQHHDHTYTPGDGDPTQTSPPVAGT